MPAIEIGAIAEKVVEYTQKVGKAISTAEKIGKTVETITDQKDENWGSRQLVGAIKNELSVKLKDYLNNAESKTETSSTNESKESNTIDSQIETENSNDLDYSMYKKNEVIVKDPDFEYKDDCSKEQSSVPVKTLKEKLNEYFNTLDSHNDSKCEVAEDKSNDQKKLSENQDRVTDKKSPDSLNERLDQKNNENSDNKEVNDENKDEQLVSNESDERIETDNVVKNKADNNEIPAKDIDENALMELTENVKQALRDAGMSEENINKCMMDQNGKVYLKTINSILEGKTHPETGVKYIRKTINLNGIEVEGVFPEFDKVFDCYLSEDLLKASDAEQFAACMEKLKEAIENDPSLATEFSPRQIERIMDGHPPRIPGYIWHHNEESGKMELIKDSDHQKSNHTGGRSIWGGGNDNR